MAPGKERMMDRITIRLGVYLLPIPIFIFYALSLTGCISTSPGIPNIYLLRLEPRDYMPGSEQSFQVRIGYFGICIGDPSDFECFSTSGLSSEALINRTVRKSSITSTSETLAKKFVPAALMSQSKVFLCLLEVAGIQFFIAVTLLTLLKRNLKDAKATSLKRRMLYKRGSIGSLWFSAALALAASVSTTEAVGALQSLYSMETLFDFQVKIVAGIPLQVLQWLAFSFSTAFALGISMVFKSTDGAVTSAGSDVEKGKPKASGGNGGGSSGSPPIPAF